MPIKVTKYTCAFRCGKNAESRLANMVRHEAGCTKNPETKSCRTCLNEIYERDSDDYREWCSRGCKLKIMNDWFDGAFELLKAGNGLHIKPICHCPNWNSETVAPNTENYLEDILEKILAYRKPSAPVDGLPF